MTASPAPSAWNLPNLLTVLRILLVPVFGWLLLSDGGHDPVQRLLALLVLLVAMFTDQVDGKLARERGQVTPFGMIADPIADKALLGMGFVGLSILGELPWWVTVLVLAREISVTLVRLLVIRQRVMPAGWGGKLKTVLQATALSLLVAPLWVLPWEALWRAVAYGVMTLAVLLTVATGLDYLLKARSIRRSGEHSWDGGAGHWP